MTVNKAQGQTIPNVGMYFLEPVYSHGQLYVALSRATARSTIKILSLPPDAEKGDKKDEKKDKKKSKKDKKKHSVKEKKKSWYIHKEYCVQGGPNAIDEVIYSYIQHNIS